MCQVPGSYNGKKTCLAHKLNHRFLRMHVFRFVACIILIAVLIIFSEQSAATRLEKLLRNVNKSANIGYDKNDWTNINEEVDVVTPMVVSHLHKLGIEHLQLPDMKETLTIKPLFVTYEVGLYLTNGIVFNVSGITRHTDAFMTYQGKSFISRFLLKINKLQEHTRRSGPGSINKPTDWNYFKPNNKLI
ncbi:uncharacterized protein LOC116654530 isoform X3 [Drosophila ananassae]|uniref:uncharacterized protein LOC116654530 isoform X3 n=1 Tax=Drosophila ananassae TaxID=7217 RepID=UPI001CFFCD77|nr:uncharacterized protein LOC116654530 isoform X3 [Drosophila ananassae]